MNNLQIARQLPRLRVLKAIGFSLITSVLPISAAAQVFDLDDLFDELHEYSDNEFILELETEEDLEVFDDPQDLQDIIRLDPVQFDISRNFLSFYKPEVSDPRLVHAQTFQKGTQIQRGSKIKFGLSYHAPEGVALHQHVYLFSKLTDPEHELHEDTEFELNGPEDLEIKWRSHNGPKYASIANINDRWQSASRPDEAESGVSGQGDYFGAVYLETANLKPGDYNFGLQVYRNENDVVVETDNEYFSFTIVDAPIAITAFLPDQIAPYNQGRSVQTGEYEAAVSDWAVPPYRIDVASSVPGFSFDYSGQDTRLETNDAIFEFIARPKPNMTGKTAQVTLRVTDGLGRVGVSQRQIKIGDGDNAEIKVTMPQSVNAGQSIMGTVSYPSGFVLKKPPTIGDKRGFEWTNSDYTAFRLTPAEEEVHHTRLFAIIASGTMPGVIEDPVLVWKQEYTVKSQNLIYDEARNRRRTEANNRAWREAMGALAAGVGAAAQAYGEVQADQRQSNSDYRSSETSDEGFYEITGTEIHGNDAGAENPGNDIYEIVGSETQFGQTSATSDASRSPEDKSNSTVTSANRIVSPKGVSGQLDFSKGEPKNICGIDNSANEWRVLWDDLTFSQKFVPEVGVPGTIGNPNAKLYHIEMIKRKPEAGTHRKRNLSFYAKNCVLKSEFIPRLDEYTIHFFWDNGGKKEIEISDGFKKSWDRVGNLIEYWPKEQGSADICSNKNEKYKRCS